MVVVALLALNLWVSSRALSPNRGADPLQPDVPHAGHGRQRQLDLLDRRCDPGDLQEGIRYQGNAPTIYFSTQIPSFANHRSCSTLLNDEHVTINAQNPNAGPSFLESILFGFGPTLLLVLLFVFIMRRAAGGGGAGGLMSFGRSRARRVEASDQPVTFEDVAGIDEAKEELTEIVDFLKKPDKYLKLGGRDPARRAAQRPAREPARRCSRARSPARPGVPFFQMSASEFVEMIVGVGASRVRDLFAQAKAAAPAIIFIDELDAVGRSRASGGPNISGGHDEREQTLNQILTEMDGFDPRTGVIVLGATNRPEILDPALLRPGRFDRRVVVQPPDRAGREAILARPHALGPAGAGRRPRRRSRPRRPAWSAPTSPTSSTRRRCSPPSAATRRSPART